MRVEGWNIEGFLEEWDTSNYRMEEKQDVDSHVKISIPDLLVKNDELIPAL